MAGKLRQQVGVGRRLAGVRVEAAVRDVEEPRAQAGVDELGGQLEPVGQRRVRVGRLGLVVLADLLQAAAAGVGVGRRALHEIEQAAAAFRLGGPFDDLALLLLVGAVGGGDLQLESSSVVIDGTRTGARPGPGATSLLLLRWNDGAPGSPLSALPIQPSLTFSACWPPARCPSSGSATGSGWDSRRPARRTGRCLAAARPGRSATDAGRADR